MLEGTLDDFTLPDILQLLAFTGKTGRLRIEREGHQGRVWFRDGHVRFATSDTGRIALGRRLVGAGLVTTDQLERALEQQRAPGGRGLRLGRILIEDGALDEQALESMVREQVQDAIFDLMRWTGGAFRFDVEASDATIEEDIELTASVEDLVMEGSRRLDEWDTVRHKIPSTQAVVAMARPPADSGVEVSLTADEWRLLTLVDGRRTVGDLVDLCGQGEFATSRLLYGMVGAGLLEVRDPALDGPPSIAALLEQHDLLARLDASGPNGNGRAATAAHVPTATAAAPADTAEPGTDVRQDHGAATVPTTGGDAPQAGPQAEAETTAEARTRPGAGAQAVSGVGAGPQARPDDTRDAGTGDGGDDAAGQPPDRGRRPAARAAATAVGSAAASPSDAEEAGPDGPDSPAGAPLTTDPDIDADLVRRLIDGVRGL